MFPLIRLCTSNIESRKILKMKLAVLGVLLSLSAAIQGVLDNCMNDSEASECRQLLRPGQYPFKLVEIHILVHSHDILYFCTCAHVVLDYTLDTTVGPLRLMRSLSPR